MRFISARILAALLFSAAVWTAIVPTAAAANQTGNTLTVAESDSAVTVKTIPYVMQPGANLLTIAQKVQEQGVSLVDMGETDPHVQASALFPKHAHTVTGSPESNPKKAKPRSAAPGYIKEIDATATAYTYAQGTIDRMGQHVKFGVIAVDPNVIPLGSKVRITGMDMPGFPSTFIATAADTGGAIKGNRIDVFLPVSDQQAMDFGVQHLKIYVM